MNRKVVVALLAAALCAGLAVAEEPGIGGPPSVSLVFRPGVMLPLGEDTQYFTTGGGLSLGAALSLPSLPLLFFPLQGAYGIIPVDFNTALSVLSLGTGIGVGYNVLPRVEVQGWATGGYFYGFLNDGSGSPGGNPYVSGGVGASYRLGRALSLGLSVSYANYLGLYSGLELAVSTAYRFGQAARAVPGAGPFTQDPLLLADGPLELKDVVFQDVFPMFFKHYDDHPLGTAVLKNPGREAASDLKVSLFIKQYMDNPKECAVEPVIDRRGEQRLDLTALFTERVLEITEATKVSAEITFEYAVGGGKFRERHVETIRILDRNAITWDDDRKAAVFVTPKDPTVLTFSKNVASLIEGAGSRAINQNLRLGMAFYQALSLYGLAYIVDPKTPYKEYSRSKEAVDFLQFPRQTVQYKAGDCDDLTILYCSLLESVGIETAFITVPGHIFMAFSLDLPPEEARKVFYQDDELVF